MSTRIIMLGFLCFLVQYVFSQQKQVAIDGATLTYTEKGTGDPIIFIHGHFDDLRMWQHGTDLLADHYRVLAYSRRLNFPNYNNTSLVNYSAEAEADDLASFIKELQIAPVHVAGNSFGGLVAIVFAFKYPQLTKSIIVSDPLLINVLQETEDGREAYENYVNYFIRPVKIAFDLRDTADVLRHTITYLYGDNIVDKLTPEQKERFISNFEELKALVNSPNALTTFTGEYLKNLAVPLMVISTGSPMKASQITNRKLREMLPAATYVELQDASYNLWETHAKQLSEAVHRFITSEK